VPELAPFAILDPIQRQARYGVVYLRAIAGQGGCGFDETPSGEDVQAVDGKFEFPEGDVRFQVKTTYAHAIDGDEVDFRFTAQDNWIRKWRKAKVPVYFVVVVVPNDSASWLDHHGGGTHMVRTAAFWCRIDVRQIIVPKSQRLVVGTLAEWHRDLLGQFTSQVVS
jgi:hypothetical protein